MSVEENKEIVRRWVENGWNRGNLGLVDELYAPDYQPHFMPDGFPKDREGLKQFVGHYRTAMPDLHFRLEELVGEGETVVWRFTSTGTQTGELFGIPPTGRALTVTGIAISRFRAGKWVGDHVEYDMFALLQQLGVIPQPQPAGV